MGCATQISSPSTPTTVSVQPPLPLALQDASGNQLGFGVALKQGVFVAPDHLWQVRQALYYQDQPIKVLARDFRHDLLFFSLPYKIITQPTSWSTTPPGVGQPLDWTTGKDVETAFVFSAKTDFELGNVQVEDLMLLSVSANPGDSGKPLFDPTTKKIYGMLVAGDTLKDVSYFVRSDVILALAEEYLD